MRIAKIALAAAALTVASALPAHADDTSQNGFNTGDAGAINVIVNAVSGQRSGGGPDQGLLDAHCDFEQVNTLNNGATVLVVAGHATAGPRGSHRAVGTSVRCVIVNYYTGATVLDLTQANESSTAVLATTVSTTSSSWTVCAESHALYDNGDYVTTDHLRCIYPPV